MTPTTPAWSVTSQRQTTEPDASGNLVPGYNISFTTSSGQVGSVFAPMPIYGNLDAVKQLIADHAAQVNAVAGLTG